MKILELEARDFRNFIDIDVTFGEKLNVFHGANAQGKTNLLEAVYFVLTQRSFRGARAAEMVRFDAPKAYLRTRVDVGGLESDVALAVSSEGRHGTVDGKAFRSLSNNLTEGLAAIVFTPEDLQIPRGSPQERRRFLDRAVSTVWADYPRLLRDYTKTLRSRNRILRDHPPSIQSLLDAYDQQLAGLGAKVMLTRQRYLRAITPTFRHVFQQIVGSKENVSLRYLPSAPFVDLLATDVDLPSLAEHLSRRLVEARPDDVARRSTSLGPHVDDLVFSIGVKGARQFASQGQVRALVLAFRIAQILDTRDRLDHAPLLLLDDVSSELDAEKNNYLFDFVERLSCQVLVTTTRPELVPSYEKRMNYRVFEGLIEAS